MYAAANPVSAFCSHSSAPFSTDDGTRESPMDLTITKAPIAHKLVFPNMFQKEVLDW